MIREVFNSPVNSLQNLGMSNLETLFQESISFTEG